MLSMLGLLISGAAVTPVGVKSRDALVRMFGLGQSYTRMRSR